MNILRLTPTITSSVLATQLLEENLHLKLDFDEKLFPLLLKRIDENSENGISTKSISLGTAITLYLLALKSRPANIAEVGTFIGCSALSMAFGTIKSSKSKKDFRIRTCDVNETVDNPLLGLDDYYINQCTVIRGTSTTMFKEIASMGESLDMLFIDGRLIKGDFMYLGKILTRNSLIVLDDCEGTEKGIYNLGLFTNNKIYDTHIYIPPFAKDKFKIWGYSCRSTAGILLPKSFVMYANQ